MCNCGKYSLRGFSPVDPDAYDLWPQVVRQMLTLINNGTLRPGQRLQSETDLVHGFGAGRLTVRRGLAWLAERGIVAAFRGRGTFVCLELPKPLPEPPDRRPLRPTRLPED